MASLPSPISDLLTSIAASLTYDLLKCGANWIKKHSFGDGETRALERVWQMAFKDMLSQFSPPLDQYHAYVVESTIKYFIESEGMAEFLLALAIEGRQVDIDLLERQFDILHTTPPEFRVELKRAMILLIPALSNALKQEAKKPDSPLFKRVSLEYSNQTLELVKEIADRFTTSQLSNRISVPPLQLPARPLHFKGRQQELLDLQNDLQPGNIVALCGPAGIGKSALVAEFLWRITENGNHAHPSFPDGLIYYSFYQHPDINFALDHIIRSFGEQPDPTPLAAAFRVVSNKRAILVFDGAEAAVDISEILNVVGRSFVIITSRERSSIFEKIYQVLPLEEDESTSLLQAIGGKWASDPLICKKVVDSVGNLPLSIWLIGSYLKERQQSASEFQKWLDESPLFTLNISNKYHESVEVLIEKSLTCISRDAKQGLGIVGLFGSSPIYSETLVAAIGGNRSKAQISLGELVKFGFLRKEGDYYEVYHALIYTYARERLSLSTEALSFLSSYFRFFTLLEPPHDYPEEEKQKAIEIVESEFQHLIPILNALLDHGKYKEVLIIARTAQDYLLRRGDSFFRLKVCILALEAAQKGDLQEDEIVMLRAVSGIYEDFGQFEESMKCLERMLELTQIIGDRSEECLALIGIGNNYHQLQKYEKAISYYNNALAIAKDIKTQDIEGTIYGNLGNVCMSKEQFEQAIDYYSKSQELARIAQDQRGEVENMLNFAIAYKKTGMLGKAIESMQEALAISKTMRDFYLEAHILNKLGELQMGMGNLEIAGRYFEESVEIVRSLHDPSIEIETLDYLGRLYSAQGEIEKAIETAKKSINIAREIRNKKSECILLINIASAYSEIRDKKRAIEHYQEAIVIAKECDFKEYELVGYYGIGLNYFEDGKYNEAKEFLEQAFELLPETYSEYKASILSMLLFLSLND